MLLITHAIRNSHGLIICKDQREYVTTIVMSFPEHISKTAWRISTILHTHDTTCHRCAFWGVRPSEGKKRSKKFVTCHVVYLVYLEKRSTDFNAVYFFNYYIFGGFYVYWQRGFPCFAHLILLRAVDMFSGNPIVLEKCCKWPSVRQIEEIEILFVHISLATGPD
jgi:hypothetical protein